MGTERISPAVVLAVEGEVDRTNWMPSEWNATMASRILIKSKPKLRFNRRASSRRAWKPSEARSNGLP